MMTNKIFLPIIIAALFICVIACKENKDRFQINNESLKNSIEYLSSPELDGRMAGSKGYLTAAEYAKSQFKKMGVNPLLDNGYFQNVTAESNEFIGDPTFTITTDDKLQKLVLGEDYLFRGLSGSGDIETEIIFCGYGISEPEIGYDDYNDINIDGKIALVIKENPKWSFDGIDFSEITTRYKTKKAIKHGAKAVIYCNSIHQTYIPKPIGSVMDGKGIYTNNIPQLHIERDIANKILATKNLSLDYCQKIIDATKRAYSVELPTVAKIKVKTDYKQQAVSPNILAVIPGSDIELKDQYIVVGAHLDHVGRQTTDFYFPGANDNASGVSAVLEIAKAFISEEEKPKRSVVFALFAGEESGMNGSSHFVNNLPFKQENIKAMINLDCIAHGDSIEVNGGDMWSELWHKTKTIDKNSSQLMTSQSLSSNGSDAEPFNKLGIPTASFVSKYSYTHIHQHTDTPSTLNYDLLEKITNLAYSLTKEVAE